MNTGPRGPPPSYDAVVSTQEAGSSSGDIYQGYQKSPDFEIVVTDPQKLGDGMKQYVLFTVKTRTSLPGYSQKDLTVHRRFRDFAMLYDRLCEKNKGIIVPPLPEKNAMQKVVHKYKSEFVESRRKALQVFINRVAAHPSLKDSQDLQTFLEAQDNQWSFEYQRYQGEVGGPQNQLTKLIKDGTGHLKSIKKMIDRKPEDEGEDPEYIRMRDYMGHLERHLAEAHRQAERLVAKQHDLSTAIQEFGEAAGKLGKFEQGSLQDAFSSLGDHTDKIGEAAKINSEKLSAQFETPLREFVRYVKGVKAVMADRQQAVAALQAAKGDLERKKGKLNQLSTSSTAKPEKVKEGEEEIMAGQQKVQQLEGEYTVIRRRMDDELVRFQQDRAAEMAIIMREFALAQAQLASSNAHTWSNLLKQIQQNA